MMRLILQLRRCIGTQKQIKTITSSDCGGGRTFPMSGEPSLISARHSYICLLGPESFLQSVIFKKSLNDIGPSTNNSSNPPRPQTRNEVAALNGESEFF